MMTNFHLNTTVVAIFPNVCLWRRSLCSDLVLTLKNRIEPPSYAKNLGNLRDFFGQMVYRPPWQKISRTPMMTQFTIILLNYPKSRLKPLAQLHMKIDTLGVFFAQIN